MAELMLKPGWPRSLRRTLGAGKKARVIEFRAGEPVDVSAAELAALKPDIGVALYEVDRDEKGRPRFVETVAIEVGNAATMQLEPASVANL